MKRPGNDRAPTVDRMRIDIDRGQTGEKAASEDPAAAPLGTDAEAGGAPPTQAERNIEVNARSAATAAATARKGRSGVYLLCGAGVATGLLLVVSLIYLA